MEKKNYIFRQLGRTKNKKHEQYVVTRIIHLLNDFDVKFVTQQYITRPNNKRALTDLYFPQLQLHIEVDEEHHIANIELDKIRELDIVNATNHEIMRVDTSKSFDDINQKIDQIVNRIKQNITELKDKNSFKPWDIDSEFNPRTYVDKGYIDIADDVAFQTIADACNCFGHNYTNYQQAIASHPFLHDTALWFPKLYPNGIWINSLSDDEEVIEETNAAEEKAIAQVRSFLSNTSPTKYFRKRIVFARVKGSLGDVLYRFKGLYQLDLERTNERTGLVWKRISIKVETYQRLTAVTTEIEKIPTSAEVNFMNTGQIAKIHDDIFSYLLDYKAKNKDFYFMPRQKQNKKTRKLDQGYWFNGDDHYLLVNFYNGGDAINKTTNINFGVYLSSKYKKTLNTCYIQLANTPDTEGYEAKQPVIEEILKKINGFEIHLHEKGIPRRWQRYYSSTNYLKNIEEFITKDKPIIDEIVKSYENSGIEFLDPTKANKKIENIENRRIKKS